LGQGLLLSRRRGGYWVGSSEMTESGGGRARVRRVHDLGWEDQEGNIEKHEKEGGVGRRGGGIY